MEKRVVSLIFGIFLISMLAISFAFIGCSYASASAQEQNQPEGQNQNQSLLQEGNYTVENGTQLIVKKQNKNKTKLKIKNVTVDTELNITQEQVQEKIENKTQNKTKLHVNLSNGRFAEIKIMPDTASETALQRLRLKVCNESNNCTIVLKEVGQKNQTKVAYELQAERHAKLLGFFRLKMQVKAQVDAETGELIRVKKPWWAFLAAEPGEDEEADEESGDEEPEDNETSDNEFESNETEDNETAEFESNETEDNETAEFESNETEDNETAEFESNETED